jgi:hypothetical protein
MQQGKQAAAWTVLSFISRKQAVPPAIAGQRDSADRGLGRQQDIPLNLL